MPELSYPHTPVSAARRGIGLIVFLLAIATGIAYCTTHLVNDLQPVRLPSALPYLLLALALLVALGFEFVNGFMTRPTRSPRSSTRTRSLRCPP